MTRSGDNNALQVIFSFFLGLMVLAFIGIAVNTFYPSPNSTYEDQLQTLYRRQERYNTKAGGSLNATEQAQYDRVQTRIDSLQKRQRAQQQIWARNTSIVVILFATAVMAISLIRSEQLRVVSNGLLLGGLFTMVYGAGWVIFSGESVARFFVISFAFVVTLALGYIKFAREREVREVPPQLAMEYGGVSSVGGDAWAQVSARLERLEARTAAAAAALGAERSTTPSTADEPFSSTPDAHEPLRPEQ